MAAPSLDHEFMEYWSKLTLVQKESLLKVVKNFVQPELGVDVETYNREIDEAVVRFNAGQGIKHEEVVRLSKLW